MPAMGSTGDSTFLSSWVMGDREPHVSLPPPGLIKLRELYSILFHPCPNGSLPITAESGFKLTSQWECYTAELCCKQEKPVASECSQVICLSRKRWIHTPLVYHKSVHNLFIYAYHYWFQCTCLTLPAMMNSQLQIIRSCFNSHLTNAKAHSWFF